MSHFTSRAASVARTPRRVAAPLALVLAFVAAQVADASLLYSVGNKEVVYTASQRQSLGLNFWPDGNMGVASAGNGYVHFYGANSSSSVRTTGTLASPGQSKQNVSIFGTASGLNYIAGGPIYTDSTTGTRLMLYHAEQHFGSAQNYSSSLGLAIATDSTGLRFQDLGLVIQPNQSTFAGSSLDVGGGSLTLANDYLYVHYRDYLAGGGSSQLAVARAPLSSVLNSAWSRQPAQFTKYYNGAWSQPGRGGLSSPLEAGNPANGWSSVSYNDYLNQFVMVTAQWAPTDNGDLYMAASPDGVNWSSRQAISVGSGEQFYPSIVGTGADPTRTGKSFYVYYTDSVAGAWNRWNDAQLARREITFDPAVTSPPPNPGTIDWTSVSSFVGDFQAGGPAQGWNYLWNPTGKTGNASALTPLKWSSAAGAYNTTGGATQVWTSGKGHTDDYLNLSATGGHPGQAGYNVIASYTIQTDDGAGLYRLSNGAVAKADSTVSPGEDGLNLMVYVNNALVGATQSVSTNGSFLNFARDLGQLSIGDTVYVMLNAAANQNYDTFRGLDFTIQRGGLSTGAPAPNPVPQPPAPTMAWASISSFAGDFQNGGPAQGWKYLWNPTGKTGNASALVPLKWSTSAGVYNTTGGATQVWTSGKGHSDDYLSLWDGGGHPGQPGFNVIAAYTIQADDGAGLYRLINGAVAKDNNVVNAGEDGLNLMVYVNNALVGATQAVSVNGTALNFTRDLGQLSVGDTIYVMLNAGANQTYDGFRGLDFVIQKLTPVAAQMFAAVSVPEPTSGALALTTLAASALVRRRRPSRRSV
jgi:MYXO-CTERM domain-containing protein